MDLFDAQWKTEIQNVMKNVFDTFARTTQLRFYKSSEEIITIVDTSYNADFQESNRYNASITSNSVYTDFTARIIYLDRQPAETFLTGSEELNVKNRQFYGLIKIQLEQDGYEYLKASRGIEFEGEKYHMREDIRKIGLAKDFQFYNIVLVKTP